MFIDLYASKAGEAIGHAIRLVIGDWRNSLSLKELPFIMVMWSLSLEQTGEIVHFSEEEAIPCTLYPTILI